MAAYSVLNSKRVTRAIVGFGQKTDHRLMIRVNHWRAPRWLRLWMMAATRGGDGWLWYATGTIVLLFGGRNRWVAVLTAMSAVSLGIALFLRLKRAFGRKRPCS